MKFNFDEWKDKDVCMCCETKEEAESFCQVMEDAGLMWKSNTSYTKDTNFDRYLSDTVYYFNNGTFGCCADVSESTIKLKWSDYMNDTEVLDTIKKPSHYEKAIEDMITHCRDTLIKKHNEYATDDDFHNFNVAAKLQDVTPEQALMGMAAKHVVSVCDFINDAAAGISVSKDMWREKIGDNINYLLILWAMVTE